MPTFIRKLLEHWMGMDALRADLLFIAERGIALRRELDGLRKDYALSRANRVKLQDDLDRAHFQHSQDQAAIAMVAGQRWGAVSALVGGVEQLQHKWLDEAEPLPAKDPRRACANELGGLKRSIQRQFGTHPSQAAKTAAEVLGREPMGRLSQAGAKAAAHMTPPPVKPYATGQTVLGVPVVIDPLATEARFVRATPPPEGDPFYTDEGAPVVTDLADLTSLDTPFGEVPTASRIPSWSYVGGDGGFDVRAEAFPGAFRREWWYDPGNTYVYQTEWPNGQVLCEFEEEPVPQWVAEAIAAETPTTVVQALADDDAPREGYSEGYTLDGVTYQVSIPEGGRHEDLVEGVQWTASKHWDEQRRKFKHLDAVKALRKETGSDLVACDAALQLAHGDPDEARGILRKQGTIHGYPHSLRTAVELAKEAGKL